MNLLTAYDLQVNQKIIRGDKWDGLRFVVTKAGIDYTSCTIKCQYRTAPDAAVLLEQNITPISASSNQVEFDVKLSEGESALFSTGTILTDVQITTDSDGVRTPILIRLNVTKDITQ
jgi:hypothetical protein